MASYSLPPRKRALHSYFHGFGKRGTYGSLTIAKTRATVFTQLRECLFLSFSSRRVQPIATDSGSGRGRGSGQNPADATAGDKPIDPALRLPHNPYIFSHTAKTSDFTPLGGCTFCKEVKLTPPAAFSFPFLSSSLLQTCNSFA